MARLLTTCTFLPLTALQTEAHDTDKCPYAHPGEKAVRRDVRVYKYSPEACPATQVRASWLQLAGQRIGRQPSVTLCTS
jgi:hypothetical protein